MTPKLSDLTTPLAIALAFALGAPRPAAADEILDALNSAITAYSDGDVQYALDELDFARQKLLEQKTESLGVFLPEAPDGWTREVNAETNGMLAMMGGGVGAEATYTSPAGEAHKLSLIADNPMVASFAAVVSNAGAMGLKVERIGRQKFAVQDNTLTGMVANRVLIQFEGPDLPGKLAILAALDFEKLGAFGQ